MFLMVVGVFPKGEHFNWKILTHVVTCVPLSSSSSSSSYFPWGEGTGVAQDEEEEYEEASWNHQFFMSWISCYYGGAAADASTAICTIVVLYY